jgi:hypothetical protein
VLTALRTLALISYKRLNELNGREGGWGFETWRIRETINKADFFPHFESHFSVNGRSDLILI